MVARTAFAVLDIRNPLLAWLIYRGEMVSASRAHEQALSFWLMRSLSAEASTQHRSGLFEDELRLESVRAARHPGAVSRLRAFYVFEDMASAKRAAAAWQGPFALDRLAEVGILEGSSWSRHDAEWISSELGNGDEAWMDAYLRGESCGSSAIWELLVDGRALVFGTVLREEAYEVVRSTWPRSLALLELSRVAVELGSDLGLIAPMVHGDADGRKVDFMMSFEDATDPRFLERFAAYEGPRNTAALNATSDLVLPDLTPHGFALPAP